MDKISTVTGSVTIECEYSTRPGAKKEYLKTTHYKRTKEDKKKLDKYTGAVDVSASYGNKIVKVSAAVKTSWANTHYFSTETEEEEKNTHESSVEYYDNVTILVRSLQIRYEVEGAVVEYDEEAILQNVTDNYSLEQLTELAKKYMEEMYGVDTLYLEIPIELKKEIYIKWKSFNRNDDKPQDGVYAGNTSTDGEVYVARVENTPGKVNFKDGKIWNFWTRDIGDKKSGEMLLTNGDCEWKEIKRGNKFPENAVYSGLDRKGDKVWVGKSLKGEPGKITCEDNSAKDPKMLNLWCHHDGRSTHGYILIIS